MTTGRPDNIPLDVIHEDEAIVVINKSAGLVVHPAAGNCSGTLLNGLLYRYPDLASVPRAGIVPSAGQGYQRPHGGSEGPCPAHADLVDQLQRHSLNRGI